MAFQCGTALRNSQVQSNPDGCRRFRHAADLFGRGTEPTALLSIRPAFWRRSSFRRRSSPTQGGVTTIAGTWSVAASGISTAASFRIKDGALVRQCVQGNCTTDLVLNNTSIAAGQTVTVTSFTVTAGNA